MGRKIKRRSYPSESMAEGTHRRTHARDDSNSKVNRRRRERRASRENNSRHSSADTRARRSLDISIDEKTIRRRSTGETSQKKLRRKSKKVAETEKAGSRLVTNAPCEEKVRDEKKDNQTEHEDKKTFRGKNVDDSITVDMKKDPLDVTEEKPIIGNAEQKSGDEVKHENIEKEVGERVTPCKSEAPSFRETVQKQVVGVIDNALGMIGLQSKVDEGESKHSGPAPDITTNDSSELKEPKPEPI